MSAAEWRTALDRAADAGRVVEIWWRDDDAVAESAALDRLLALANGADLPVALAVIPARLEPSLPARLRDEPRVSVLVHGWQHANRAPPGARPAEFGDGRDRAGVAAELGAARTAVAAAFGRQALPIFVPPWNRIARALASLLPDAGYLALSAVGEPHGAGPPLARMDAHLDPVDWRDTRSLLPTPVRAAALRRALDGGGPVGLLTHHLALDPALWGWLEDTLSVLADHPAVRIRDAGALVAGARALPLDCDRSDGLSPMTASGAERFAP